MSALATSAAGFAAVLFLAALRMPLAFALGLVGVVGVWLIKGAPMLMFVVSSAPVEVVANYSLSVLPMFILLGALAVHSGIASDLVGAANALLGHRRGGLAMASVASCAAFGALSGSNMATLSTMSRITVPEMLRRGYSPRLAAGTLASASTLDILIPPSVPMVIYATLTQTSVGQVLASGIVPGVILTVLFMVAIRIWVAMDPEIAPPTARIPWRTRIPLLKPIWTVGFMFFFLLAGMSEGWFSPTEAAAVGAAAVLCIGVLKRRLSPKSIVLALRETAQLSIVLYLVFIGIVLFQFFLDAAGIQQEVSRAISRFDLPAPLVMGLILAGLIVLGCVMDATSILFIATPLLFPIVTGLGYDGVWFGLIMVMVIQLGLIHPPFGLNVFILVSMIKRVSVVEAFWGCVPFLIADIVLIGLLLWLPGIALWLPDLLFR